MPATAQRLELNEFPTLLVHVPHEPVDIVEYLYLAEVVARKYYRGKDRIRDTDVFSVACQELVRCGQRYDPAIGPFDRFAMRAMRNGIIQSIRDKSCKKRSAEFKVLADREWQDVPDRIENVHLSVEMLPGLLAKLPNEDRRLIEDIYIANKQINEIAVCLGVSRETIYNRRDRILKKLREGLLNDDNERQSCSFPGASQG